MEVHVNNYVIQMAGKSLNITHNGNHGEFTRVVENIREVVSLFVSCIISGAEDVGFAIVENATVFVKPFEPMTTTDKNVFYHITAEAEIEEIIKNGNANLYIIK